MTVLRFPRGRYTALMTNDGTLAVYCGVCPPPHDKVYELPPADDLADLADAVYIHERLHHGG